MSFENITSRFRTELATLINTHSMENASDTPDFILAEYMAECLKAFDKAIVQRDKWYAEDVDMG